MSADQDKILEAVAQGSAEVVVEKPPSSKVNLPYLPNLEEPLVELPNKEKVDPVTITTDKLDTGVKSGDAVAAVEAKVETVPEEVTKDTLDINVKDGDTTATVASDSVEEEVKKDTEVISSDKEKLQNILGKKTEPSSEEITVNALNMETKISSTQPIQALMAPEKSNILENTAEKDTRKPVEDQTEKGVAELQSAIAELRSDAPGPQREWSDIEVGGLPRESSTTLVTRAVRRLFCCGVPYTAPSEDNISVRRDFAI